MKDVVIKPARNVIGSIRLPGDKSISHRYAMLAALAEGTTKLQNFSTGADGASTLACVRALGCDWQRNEDGTLELKGTAGARPRSKHPTHSWARWARSTLA